MHHPFELMIQLFLKVKIIIKIQSTAPHITIFKEHKYIGVTAPATGLQVMSSKLVLMLFTQYLRIFKVEHCKLLTLNIY